MDDQDGHRAIYNIVTIDHDLYHSMMESSCECESSSAQLTNVSAKKEFEYNLCYIVV